MKPNLKNVSGLAVCNFCGSGDHVFTKETCPQFIEQDRVYKEKLKIICTSERELFLKTINTMGYNEMEFIDDVNKGVNIIDMMKDSGDCSSIEKIKVVKNYIKLNT